MLTKHPLAGEESISTEDMVSKLEPAEREVKAMYESSVNNKFQNISNNCKGGECVNNSNVSNNYIYSSVSNDGVHCTNTPEEVSVSSI